MLVSTVMSISGSHLLGLLQLSSPALPVGAFAYSQGLEFALDNNWCSGSGDVAKWIENNLEFGLGQLDLPIYCRLYSAWQEQDIERLQYWNATLLAFRETKELYLEDIQIGSAFRQWHLGQDSERDSYLNLCEQPTVAAMHSLASVLSQINLESSILGFAWSWAENQISCASKAMPMGQTDAQRILKSLMPLIGEVCDNAQDISDDDIGSNLMGTAMASALHEQQYSRLFRS
jgi:urease accessory protein